MLFIVLCSLQEAKLADLCFADGSIQIPSLLSLMSIVVFSDRFVQNFCDILRLFWKAYDQISTGLVCFYGSIDREFSVAY